MEDERGIIQLDHVYDDSTHTLDRRTIAEVLRPVENQDRAQLMSILEPLYAADIADLFEEISAYDCKCLLLLHDRRFDEEIFAQLEEGVCEDIIALLKPEVLAEAIDHLRFTDKLLDQSYHVTLVDCKMHPNANMTMGRLMSSARDISLKDIKEDILRLAGIGESSQSDSVLKITWQRFPWLAVNLVTALLASLVIAQFEATIGQLIALAILMPIIALMGGKAGTQCLTVAVRSLATRDLTDANVHHVIWREVLVGFVNGGVFAALMAVVGLLWFGSLDLDYVIATAMIVNFVIAGFAGTGVPVLLDRIGIDPALASGAFVSKITDIVGFLSFLDLAAVILF